LAATYNPSFRCLFDRKKKKGSRPGLCGQAPKEWRKIAKINEHIGDQKEVERLEMTFYQLLIQRSGGGDFPATK